MNTHALDQIIAEVRNERLRQIEEEGWTEEHDDAHRKGELVAAAMSYLTNALVYALVRARKVMTIADLMERSRTAPPTSQWPWDKKWWKPKTRRSNIVRSIAMLIAELERIDRESAQEYADSVDPEK